MYEKIHYTHSIYFVKSIITSKLYMIFYLNFYFSSISKIKKYLQDSKYKKMQLAMRCTAISPVNTSVLTSLISLQRLVICTYERNL